MIPGGDGAATIPDLLRGRAQSTPDREALRFEGRSLTCLALHEEASRLAAALRILGVRPGDRVALMLPNGIDFALAWLAIPMAGALAVPIHTGFRGRDLRHVLAHSGSALALVGSEQRETVEEARSECPALRAVGTLRDAAIDLAPSAAPSEPSPPPPPAATDPITIQYTSGTTGFPKGCVLDHRYWLTLARTIQRYAALGADDVLLTAQPQSYMDPSWNLVLALLVGAPLVVLPRFSASRFWTEAAEEGATFFYCIGTMPLYLMKQPRDRGRDRGHRVRLVYCSGIPAAQHAELEERWGCRWRETYGTTELGCVLLAPPEDEASVGSGSMGGPVAGKAIRLVGEDGADVEPGRAGELQVQGEGLMQGYYHDPEATAAWKPDAWARTGDLVAEQPSGRFRLVGRTKDMIRRAGENISAAEVEAALAEHPSVQAAACIAVPDPLRGEEVKAYVQLVPGESAAPAAIRAFLLERLARYKAPRYIEVVDAFPLTPSLKIAKADLRRSRADHVAGAWDAERAESGS